MALGKHSRKITPPKLIMTSMVDIFTFLLIFLLASFSDHVARFSIDGSVSLPKSAAKSDFKDNIRIVVSENKVWLGQDVIAQVKEGTVVGLDVNNPQSSALYHKLVQCREKAEQSTTDTKEKNLILFLCDKHLSFKTINSIIKTAGLAGFPNFQFGVLKK
jgi:biopolymer transport protein ExbD